MTRARRLARLLSILAAVIREPGLRPRSLAARASISERTLFRDLDDLARLGYEITYSDGYQLQESLNLEGAGAPRTLALVYEQQLRLLRAELPAALVDRVAADVESQAPAALAALFAAAIERRLDRATT